MNNKEIDRIIMQQEREQRAYLESVIAGHDPNRPNRATRRKQAKQDRKKNK